MSLIFKDAPEETELPGVLNKRLKADIGISVTEMYSAGGSCANNPEQYPYARFISRLDKNTCDLCRHLDGMVVRVDSEDYRRFAGCKHPGCRCFESYISRESANVKVTFEAPSQELIDEHGSYLINPEKHQELRIPAQPGGRQVVLRTATDPKTGEERTWPVWAPWWKNVPKETKALVLKARVAPTEAELHGLLAQLGITDLENPEQRRRLVMLGLQDRVEGWVTVRYAVPAGAGEQLPAELAAANGKRAAGIRHELERAPDATPAAVQAALEGLGLVEGAAKKPLPSETPAGVQQVLQDLGLVQKPAAETGAPAKRKAGAKKEPTGAEIEQLVRDALSQIPEDASPADYDSALSATAKKLGISTKTFDTHQRDLQEWTEGSTTFGACRLMAAENAANGKAHFANFVGDELDASGERQIEGDLTNERLKMHRLQQMFTEAALPGAKKAGTIILLRGDKRTVEELAAEGTFRSLSSWSPVPRVARDFADEGSVCVTVVRPSAVLASQPTCDQFSGQYEKQREYIVRTRSGIIAMRVVPAAKATNERLLELGAELRKAGLFQFRQDEKLMAITNPDAPKIPDFRTPEADRFLKHPPSSKEAPRTTETTGAPKDWGDGDDEDLNSWTPGRRRVE